MARILIVDDEEIERVFVRSVLEPQGHELLFAADGRVAFDLCRDTDIDLVITDLAMPELNGLRLIRELREAHLDMPIIAMSGSAADQLDIAEDFGAAFTLFKPVDGKKLLALVDQALQPKAGPDLRSFYR